jgi:hydrocephalus-inducing protein
VQRPSALVAKLQSGDAPNVAGHKTEIIELLNMSDFTSQIECAVEVDKPIFQPLPPVIQFSSYNAFESVRAKILFRNNDKFARRMKVLAPDSPFFCIEGPFNTKGASLVDSRVAPGTELVYMVTFTPRDVDDYVFDLVCATEREKFVVPLKASGKRAILMLPDSVSFPTVPVKSAASKTIVVRNAGSRGTEFRLVAPACFVVSPTRAFVDVDECIPVTITFSPDAVQEYDADITLVYAEGYSCLLQVSGTGNAIDVNLSSSELLLDATYVSLSATAKVSLVNSSDCPVEFSWHKLVSSLMDEQEKLQEINDLQLQYDQEVSENSGTTS